MISLVNILLEVGDASITPSPYTVVTDIPTELKMEFIVGDIKYFLRINSYSQAINKTNKIETDFGVAGTETHQWSKSTNKGDQYKVMATVVKILKDFVNDHPKLDTIIYTPAKTRGPEDRGREILYKAYVNKQISDWTYSILNGTVVLRKPQE